MSANWNSTPITTALTEHDQPPMRANPDTHRPDLAEPADGGPGPGHPGRTTTRRDTSQHPALTRSRRRQSTRRPTPATACRRPSRAGRRGSPSWGPGASTGCGRTSSRAAPRPTA